MAVSFYARADSNSANNPALNLTNADAIELVFVTDGAGGDITLETNGGGVDPDTLVEIDGVQYNFTYEYSATMPTQKKHGAQQVPDQYEGSLVVLVTVQDYPTPGESTRFAFLPTENATAADMDDFGNGAINVQNLDTTPTSTPICFARGTLIETSVGEKPIETLRVGDMVRNAAGDLVPLRWISSSQYDYGQLVFVPKLRPVCIPAGYFGRGAPHSDLWVSRQHRIVVHGWAAELYTGQEAVFIPASHLMGAPQVPGPDWLGGVEYFHLLFDRHEILLSNGLQSESLFVGKEALDSVGPEARLELQALLDDWDSAAHAPAQTALTTLTATEGEVLRPAMRAVA